MAALNSKVRKAVIPVAGLGTRMLPATKAIPKEMLPLVDKPLIQYVVNECIAAGITEIVLVTHSSKNSIENHFDTSFELEAMLEKRVKRQLLEEVQSICPPHVTIMQVRQGLAKGLGHAYFVHILLWVMNLLRSFCQTSFWTNMNPICLRITLLR